MDSPLELPLISHDLAEFRGQQVHHPEWKNGWWQLRNRIRTPEKLRQWIHLTDNERLALDQTKEFFRWQLTPYYASLMDPDNPNCPIRRQVIPTMEELTDDIPLLDVDPLEELAHSPVKNVIHNYNDRVAFCIAADCAVYCRYCLRKRMVGDGEWSLNRSEITEGIDYLRKTSSIRDVLLTGGDPLTLNNRDLAWVIEELRKINHIEIIRIGSRFPVLNPFRIDDELCDILKEHHPVWFNTHFNHKKELTNDAASAIDKLLSAGVPVGNQTVLLKGINNTTEDLIDLFRGLVNMRVRPYYLYQAQLIGGTKQFRTTIEEGMNLMASLRGKISGFAIPTYVLDTPYGKVPLTPNGFKGRDGDMVRVESYSGRVWKEYNPLG